jgi:tetratricopeptide (TPR) repeat protein
VRAWLVPIVLLAAGCSNTVVSGNAYDRGAAALAKGDARTARVEFLNFIKEQPANKAARIMQARTYILLGDGVAAEAEIDRARALGVAPSLTRPLKAHALLLQGEADEALRELGSASGAYAERMRGRALQATGDIAGAAAAYDRALALAPKDSEIWTDTALFRRSNGELVGALEAADKAVAADPANVDAILLRGELTRSQYGLRASLAWFDRAIEIDGSNVDARLERAATLGDMGETQDMLAETRKVLSIAPGNAMAFYLQAVLAARSRNFTLARSLYQRTQGRLDEQPATMLLAGTIDYAAGDPIRAAERLADLVALQPDNRKARRLLAAAQWRSGDARATVATLKPLADRDDADTYSLQLIGEALAKLGDGKAASVYLTRAANPSRRATSALFDEAVDPVALTELRGEAAANSGDAATQVKLIRALLTAGLGGEALDRARRLQADNPGAPDTHLLVGDALGIQGQFGAAATEYRKAANIAFTEPVAMRLIEALQRSGQEAAAGQVLTLFLNENPSNVPAELLAANRYFQARQWREAITVYERLRRQLGDNDAVILNNLAWAYSEVGDHRTALPLAKRAWLLDRSNPATTDTFGWLLFKSGRDRNQALALLDQAARAKP